METIETRPMMAWTWLLGGSAAIGLSLGSYAGISGGLMGAIKLPMIMLAVTALTIPALYIGTAFLGMSMSMQHVGRATLSSLGDIGLCLLGTAPAVFLLTVTSHSHLVGMLALLVAAFLGIRQLHARLFEGLNRVRVLPVFLPWAAIAAGLFVYLLIGTGDFI